MSVVNFPILKEFQHENIPLKGNQLRDKYPDVPFKDKDIDWYDYDSNKRQKLIMSEFLKQYNVRDLCITAEFKGNIKKYYYLYDIELKKGNKVTDGRNIVLSCISYEFYDDKFTIEYENLKSDFRLLQPGVKIDKEFKLYLEWHGDAEINIEINPDRKILDDYISFFVDKMLAEYNEDSIIYKHPNGCQYYTDKHCIHKHLKAYIRKEKKESTISFQLIKLDAVEPFKKYNEGYSVKSMPKKSKQISLSQMRTEFISLCNHVVKNKIELEESVYCPEDIEHLFKGQNFYFDASIEGRTYGPSFIFTNYIEKQKDREYIEGASIYKKDKLIGNFESFDGVDETIKNELMEFLVDKFGESLDLSLMDGIDKFAYILSLDIHENEEYSGDYFLYENCFDFGKYKIQVNSSKYIKDQCICDLQVDSIDIYKKI